MPLLKNQNNGMDVFRLLPYLSRPPAGPFSGRGCHRLRPALPHHSPAYAVASPELTNTEGTPPKSLTGREKVSLCPVSVIASGLPQPDQWIAWIARTAGLHHLLKAACHRAAPFAACSSEPHGLCTRNTVYVVVKDHAKKMSFYYS